VNPGKRVKGLSSFLVLAALGCAGGGNSQTYVGAAPGASAPERTVAVVVSQENENCSPAARCAQVEAVRALLFTGVPGSDIPRAMVRNEQEAMSRHADFFEELLENRGHERYIVSSTEESGGGGERTWVVIVNHEALRITMEDAGIIRKFGLRRDAV